MYWSSFARGSSTSGPWPGHSERQRAAAEPLEALQSTRGSAPGTAKMKTLPSPSTASPVNATWPDTYARWSGA